MRNLAHLHWCKGYDMDVCGTQCLTHLHYYQDYKMDVWHFRSLFHMPNYWEDGRYTSHKASATSLHYCREEGTRRVCWVSTSPEKRGQICNMRSLPHPHFSKGIWWLYRAHKSHLPGLCYCRDEGKQMLNCTATSPMIKSRITIKQT
jgi:hypothetical protein